MKNARVESEIEQVLWVIVLGVGNPFKLFTVGLFSADAQLSLGVLRSLRRTVLFAAPGAWVLAAVDTLHLGPSKTDPDTDGEIEWDNDQPKGVTFL
jgi:hypothetical protein